MDINRNQYFMVGLVLLALGFQLRRIEYYVLTQEASDFIAQRIPRPVTTSVTPNPRQSLLHSQPTSGPVDKRVVRPPDWLAWMLLSVGAVLALHSLAMKRPD